jgi:hypothetical protein
LAGCRLLDGCSDAHVGGAAAQIARHGRVDIGVIGVRRARQERRGRHNLTRLTIAALHHIDIQPGLLNFLSARGLSHGFDGRNRFVTHRTHGQHTGAHRLAVQVHGAGPALRYAAAKLRAGEPDHIAQHPKKRHVGGNVDRAGFTVDV